MSCVLRISIQPSEAGFSQASLKPYRSEDGTAHFEVSKAEIGDLSKQIEEAIAFLRRHAEDIRTMMKTSTATGILDFAIEKRDVAVQIDRFPAALLVEAGLLGIDLEISQFT